MQQIINDPAIYLTKPSEKTRYKILSQVSREVETRKARSLHRALLNQLQSERLWDVEVKIGSQPSVRLWPGKKIIEIFDLQAVGGKLLILGAPGSGKTTTLLEIAAVLVNRAFSESQHPIPVLLDLCSWQETQQTLATWIVTELQAKYGVTTELGKKWLFEGQLVPLLDGLEEVKADWQKPCVQAINQFLREFQPKHLLVTCSLAEYASGKTMLQLNAAIYLLPLNEEQIQDYLWQLQLQGIWQSIRKDPNLLNWAKSPLFLNIIALAAEEISLEEWQTRLSAEARSRYLLDAYIRYQLKQKPLDVPSQQQIRHWLSWLAKQLKCQAKSEFLIENIQPSWLPTEYQWLYRLTVGASVGLLSGVSCGFSFGILPGLISGLLFALFASLLFDIAPAEPLDWSWDNAKNGLIMGITLGLMVGLIGGGFLVASGLLAGGILGLVRTTVGGLIGGLIFGLSQGLSDSEIDVKMIPNQGIRLSAKTAGVFTLVSGVSFGLSLALFGGLMRGLSGLGLGVLTGLACGGITCIQHLTLRLMLWSQGAIPWNYESFLNWATEVWLLQKIGGRYRFMHELLRAHFAAPPLGEIVLCNKSTQLANTIVGHTEQVHAVAVSPLGDFIVSASDDKTVKIWQIAIGEDGCLCLQPKCSLSGHTDYVRAVAISPDGRYLASGSNDRTIKIWMLDSQQSGLPQGTPLLTLKGHTNWVRSVAFSPNGQILASCGDDTTINLWYLPTGQLLQTLSGHSDYVRCVAFSPDGQLLASGSDDKTINIWNVGTNGRTPGELLLTLEGHSGYVRCVAFSPNGQLLVSGSDDQTLTVWRLNTDEKGHLLGSPVYVLGGHSGLIWSVAISRDGQFLASSSRDKTIKIWQLASGELQRTIAVEAGWVFSVAFTPNGKALVSGSQDHLVRIWPL